MAFEDFKVTGCAFAADPNVAFVKDTQNPFFVVKYQNPQGEVKARMYQAYIKSIGIKFQFAIKFDFLVFTSDLANFENTNKTLVLGQGIDVSVWVLGITPTVLYAPFTNAPGGVFMGSFDFGIGGGLSLVTGGTLSPISLE